MDLVIARIRAVFTERVLRTGVGAVSYSMILAGIWGLWGWQWALIAGGTPFFTFYLWGELRAVQLQTPPADGEAT